MKVEKLHESELCQRKSYVYLKIVSFSKEDNHLIQVTFSMLD